MIRSTSTSTCSSTVGMIEQKENYSTHYYYYGHINVNALYTMYVC